MHDLKQNIVKRRPRPDAMEGAEWAIVFLPHNKMHPFVVCTLTPDTLKHDEWVHGRYHENFENANQDYACRPDGPEPEETIDPVWVAIATYAPEDDVDVLCVVAITYQAAVEQLENAIAEQPEPDNWIAKHPVERKVLK